MYPTGIYDALPTEGITIAFGPEIRQQMENVRTQSCNKRSAEECRKALNDVLQKTEVSTHVKRFVAASAFAVLLISIIIEAIYLYDHKVGKEMKFRPEDLHRIHSMAGAKEIAVVTATDMSAVPATLTYVRPATTTAS
jgi:hypothetical protein